jgi:hypothetical protein
MAAGVQKKLIELALTRPELKDKVLDALSILASPDFIPHKKWHKKPWLIPLGQKGEPWYYSGEVSRDGKPVQSMAMLETVDQSIRDLVARMGDLGIETGPSCSGHQIPTEGFQQIWNNLCSEADQIRRVGLPLKDPETGDIYVMRDANYGLPWESYEHFLSKAMPHQKIGWLPFKPRDQRFDQFLGDHGRASIERLPDGWRAVKVPDGDPRVWAVVSKALERVL